MNKEESQIIITGPVSIIRLIGRTEIESEHERIYIVLLDSDLHALAYIVANQNIADLYLTLPSISAKIAEEMQAEQVILIHTHPSESKYIPDNYYDLKVIEDLKEELSHHKITLLDAFILTDCQNPDGIITKTNISSFDYGSFEEWLDNQKW